MTHSVLEKILIKSAAVIWNVYSLEKMLPSKNSDTEQYNGG